VPAAAGGESRTMHHIEAACLRTSGSSFEAPRFAQTTCLYRREIIFGPEQSRFRLPVNGTRDMVAPYLKSSAICYCSGHAIMWGRHRNLQQIACCAHWVYENAVSFNKRGRNATNSCPIAHSLTAAINFRVSSMADYYSVIARAVLTRRELT
jgi:hypothetical protein